MIVDTSPAVSPIASVPLNLTSASMGKHSSSSSDSYDSRQQIANAERRLSTRRNSCEALRASVSQGLNPQTINLLQESILQEEHSPMLSPSGTF